MFDVPEQVPDVYRALRSMPPGVVIELPVPTIQAMPGLDAFYEFWSTTHWMPLVNGYSDVIPDDFREAAVVLAAFPSDDGFRVLAKHRVRYIAVHWDMFGPRAEDVRSRLERYKNDLRELAADRRMTLYEVMTYR